MYENKNVLDMGSGTGIQSIIASNSGAKSVLAVDINPKACKNSQYNFTYHNLDNVFVRESDLFENVTEMFDSIIAYLPSINAPTRSMKDKAVFDPGYKTFRNFLRDAKRYLKPGGIIYTCWVNIDNSIEIFYDILKKSRYEIINSKLLNYNGEEWWMFDLR